MTARIGLIIPSSNRMVEGEMVRHVPPGVVAHVARLRMTGAHRVTIDALMPRVEAAATLPTPPLLLFASHCTNQSHLRSPSRRDKAPPRLAEAAARP